MTTDSTSILHTLDAINSLSRALNIAQRGSAALSEQIRKTEKNITKLGRSANQFNRLTAASKQTKKSIAAARIEIRQIVKEIKSTTAATNQQTDALKRQLTVLARLRDMRRQEREQIKKLRIELSLHGILLTRNASATQQITQRTAQYNRQLVEQRTKAAQASSYEKGQQLSRKMPDINSQATTESYTASESVLKSVKSYTSTETISVEVEAIAVNNAKAVALMSQSLVLPAIVTIDILTATLVEVAAVAATASTALDALATSAAAALEPKTPLEIGLELITAGSDLLELINQLSSIDGLVSWLTGKISWLAEKIRSIPPSLLNWRTTAAAVSAAVSGAILSIIHGATRFKEVLLAAFRNPLGAISGAFSWLTSVAGSALRGLLSIGRAAFSGLLGIGSSVFSALATTIGFIFSPLGLIIGLLVLAGVMIYKYWEPIKAFFSGFFTGLIESLSPVAEAFDWLPPIFDSISTAIGNVWQWFKELFSPVESSAEGLAKATEAGKTFGEVVGYAINLLLFPLKALANTVGWVLEKLGLVPKAAKDAQKSVNSIELAQKTPTSTLHDKAKESSFSTEPAKKTPTSTLHDKAKKSSFSLSSKASFSSSQELVANNKSSNLGRSGSNTSLQNSIGADETLKIEQQSREKLGDIVFKDVPPYIALPSPYLKAQQEQSKAVQCLQVATKNLQHSTDSLDEQGKGQITVNSASQLINHAPTVLTTSPTAEDIFLEPRKPKLCEQLGVTLARVSNNVAQYLKPTPTPQQTKEEKQTHAIKELQDALKLPQYSAKNFNQCGQRDITVNNQPPLFDQAPTVLTTSPAAEDIYLEPQKPTLCEQLSGKIDSVINNSAQFFKSTSTSQLTCSGQHPIVEKQTQAISEVQHALKLTQHSAKNFNQYGQRDITVNDQPPLFDQAPTVLTTSPAAEDIYLEPQKPTLCEQLSGKIDSVINNSAQFFKSTSTSQLTCSGQHPIVEKQTQAVSELQHALKLTQYSAKNFNPCSNGQVTVNDQSQPFKQTPTALTKSSAANDIYSWPQAAKLFERLVWLMESFVSSTVKLFHPTLMPQLVFAGQPSTTGISAPTLARVPPKAAVTIAGDSYDININIDGSQARTLDEQVIVTLLRRELEAREMAKERRLRSQFNDRD